MKQEDFRDTFTKVSYGVCSSTLVVSPDLLFYSINFFSPRKQRSRPWWPWSRRWRKYPSGILLW